MYLFQGNGDSKRVKLTALYVFNCTLEWFIQLNCVKEDIAQGSVI